MPVAGGTGPRSIRILTVKERVAEHLVIALPEVSTFVDCGLRNVIVFVEVSAFLKVEARILGNVGNASSGVEVALASMLLEAKDSGPGERKVPLGVFGGLVGEATVCGLGNDKGLKPFVDYFIDAGKL